MPILSNKPPIADTKSPEEVWLLAFLRKRGHVWTKSLTIRNQAGSELGHTWSRRYLSSLTELSHGSILSSNTGYMLADAATQENILTAYQFQMRKVLGGEKHAREIISSARRKGILVDATKTAQIDQQIKIELDSGKPADPETFEETDLFLAPFQN